jgi:hypothetical protein
MRSDDELYNLNSDELAWEFLDRFSHATPDQLNGLCRSLIERGGKFKILALYLIGEIDLEEADRRLDNLS